MVRTLLIDNYDSYSYNLYQYLWEINGAKPLIVRNDAMALAQIRTLDFDNVVLSPGPGHPGNSRDFGVCADVVRELCERPVLGICLGHQGMGLHLGFHVGRAPRPMHGKISRVLHDGEGLFRGLPNPFPAVRYHSLALIAKEPCPPSARITATAEDDGTIMGLCALGRPLFGLQFHPESVRTECGRRLLRNFRDLSRPAYRAAPQAAADITLGKRPAVPSAAVNAPKLPAVLSAADTMRKLPSVPPSAAGNGGVLHREFPWLDPEQAFLRFFAEDPVSFWLDGGQARAGAAWGEGESGSRFSLMGAAGAFIEIRAGSVRFRTWPDDPDRGRFLEGDPFSLLKERLARQNEWWKAFDRPPLSRLPFAGGLVGYFGYELGRFAAPPEYRRPRPPLPPAEMPDGFFMEPDRLLVFDHGGRRVFAIHLAGPPPREGGGALSTGDGEEGAEAWFSALASSWESPGAKAPGRGKAGKGAGAFPIRESVGPDGYRRAVRDIQERIRDGETYEVCLTQSLEATWNGDTLELYRVLRRVNPAPYGAYMRTPHGAVLSASPERFLKLDRSGTLSSRPIKGTRRRGSGPAEDARLHAELESSGKDFSENLMIVDLVRNDFGKVCEPGSVEVPWMMRVEAHPTVFQLVSEVRGRLSAEFGALDAVRACFPGGSMTGAPKLRTMEILEELEGRPRGVYSGALGYLAYGGGMDLSMVIRALVVTPGKASVGCGGAVVLESDPDAEYLEAMAKAEALMEALGRAPRAASGAPLPEHAADTA